MAWYEVINGSAGSAYNKKLYSIIGQKFGLFYFNKDNRIHVFLNTNTRFSFVKQSVELDPIDEMPKMNHYFVSGARKEKDYYDTGVEFSDIKDIIEKLADGQGVMFWFMYYDKKPPKDQYVLQEDKYLVRIIFMQRVDKFSKQKPDEDLTNVIMGMIQNSIKTEITWKELKGTRNKIYSGELMPPLLISRKKVLYTYKARIENFLELDYSTKEMKLPPGQHEESGYLEFKRDESDNAIILDEKSEIINSMATGERSSIISGEGKIGVAAKAIAEAEKNGREIAILNTAKFDPFKNIINSNTSFSIKRFDISPEYYERRVVSSVQDSQSLASKLWAGFVTGTESLRNPLIIVNTANDIVPVTSNGIPLYENEFWSSFFKFFGTGSNGMGIIFLKDGELETMKLYADYAVRATRDDSSFDIIKN